MPDRDEWSVAGTFTAPDGPVRVEQWQAPNDRGAPYERWRVTIGGERYGLPGEWRGPPVFGSDGTFVLELECYTSRYRMTIDPLRKTFTLPSGEVASLEALGERVRAFESTYRALSAETAEWKRESIGWSIFSGVACLVLIPTCALLLFHPSTRPLKGWQVWGAMGVLALVAVSSFHDARQELRKRRRRQEAREELARLIQSGP